MIEDEKSIYHGGMAKILLGLRVNFELQLYSYWSGSANRNETLEIKYISDNKNCSFNNNRMQQFHYDLSIRNIARKSLIHKYINTRNQEY